jgi:hypothetical protein
MSLHLLILPVLVAVVVVGRRRWRLAKSHRRRLAFSSYERCGGGNNLEQL